MGFIYLLKGECFCFTENEILHLILSKLDVIDTRFDSIENRFDSIDTRLYGIEADIETIKEDTAITRDSVNTIIDVATNITI